MNLRGTGLAAAAALYPDPECEHILLEAQLSTGACEGGRNLLSNDTSASAFVKMSWSEKLRTLYSIARIKGLNQIWGRIVQPWLKANGTGEWSSQA